MEACLAPLKVVLPVGAVAAGSMSAAALITFPARPAAPVARPKAGILAGGP